MHSGVLSVRNTYNTCFFEPRPRCFVDNGELLHTTSYSFLQHMHCGDIYAGWLWLVCCCYIAAAWINRDKSSQYTKYGYHATGTCQDAIKGSLLAAAPLMHKQVGASLANAQCWDGHWNIKTSIAAFVFWPYRQLCQLAFSTTWIRPGSWRPRDKLQ